SHFKSDMPKYCADVVHQFFAINTEDRNIGWLKITFVRNSKTDKLEIASNQLYLNVNYRYESLHNAIWKKMYPVFKEMGIDKTQISVSTYLGASACGAPEGFEEEDKSLVRIQKMADGSFMSGDIGLSANKEESKKFYVYELEEKPVKHFPAAFGYNLTTLMQVILNITDAVLNPTNIINLFLGEKKEGEGKREYEVEVSEKIKEMIIKNIPPEFLEQVKRDKIQIRGTTREDLVSSEKMWAMAGLAEHPDKKDTLVLYIHQEYLKALEALTDRKKEEMLAALARHEVWEYKLVNIYGIPQEIAHLIVLSKEDINEWNKALKQSGLEEYEADTVEQIIQNIIETNVALQNLIKEIQEDKENQRVLEKIAKKVLLNLKKLKKGESIISPKIELSKLMGLLKELSRKKDKGESYYQDLMENSEKLKEMVEQFTGKKERIDSLIFKQSSYRRQSSIELIANAVDAIMVEMDIDLIGRFGIGAFQSLAELEEGKEGDYVSWTTSKDGERAYRIIISKGAGEDEYYYQSQIVYQGVSKGTQVKVHKKNYSKEKQKSLEEFIRSKLYLNYRARIYINGKLINPLEKVLFINGKQLNYLSNELVNISINENGYEVDDPGIGMDSSDLHKKLLISHRGKKLPEENLTDKQIREQVKVFYKPMDESVPVNEEVESSIHLQVAGNIIESFQTKGFVLPKDLVVELPASTFLTNDRQHVQLSKQTIKAIKEAINKVIRDDCKNQVELMNGLAYLLESLAERDEHGEDILQYMNNLVRDWQNKQEDEFIFLPNEKEFFEIQIPKGKKVIYISNAILPFNIQEYPGAFEVSSWQSEKYSLWVLPFEENSDKISFEFGRFIILNQKYYECYKDNPAPVDLEINPVVTGYEPVGYEPKPKGKFLPEQPAIEKQREEEKVQKSAKSLPSEIQKRLQLFTGDLSALVSERITHLFKISKQTEDVIDKMNIWLKRFAMFAERFAGDSVVLSDIIQTFNLDTQDLKPQVKQVTENYTKVKEVKIFRDGLGLDITTSSTSLADGNIATYNEG
ncbi:hypothetical protein KAU39_06920, partial [bacterium]|nr:hypothetical protein [bacterium]